MKRIVTLGLALIALGGCNRSSASIALATAGPWNEAYGAMNKRGMDLAIAEINARGGVDGRQLTLIDENDEGDGAKAAAIAGRFVANPSIVAVVGHVNSGAMVAAARVYDNALPAVSPTATSPDLSGISPWVFRVISSDSANGLDMARFAQNQGFKRAAILYENNPYGRGLVDAFRRNFRGDIITVDPLADGREADFEPYIAFLKSRSPDVVFVAGTEGSGIGVLREARKQNLQTAFIGGDGWAGVVTDTAASEGVYVGAPFTATDPREEAQRFVSAFRAKYQMEPDGFAALAYDATMLLARAVDEAGPNRKAIRDWLSNLDQEKAFKGVTGSIHFRESGDVVGKGIVMTRVKKGALLVQRDGGRS